MKRYIVGIDLGTSHSVLSFLDTQAESPTLELFEVPQLVSPTTLEARPLLASNVYLAHESEPALGLPWDAERRFAVGELGRRRGEDAPGRVVASAKSWLSHAGVDRRAPLLPQTAAEGVEKVSPVEASFRVLEHLAEALVHTTRARGEGIDPAHEEVVLTVPASFDAVARELTVEAAMAAGFDQVTLLEEPQAAVYAWTHARGEAWRRELRVGDVLLVVDVGGGTTDFSAILVVERDGALELERVAVGDHVLLGGDNMDLLLAHVVTQKLEDQGIELDAAQASALVFQCRAAKEKLLGDDSLDEVPLALASRGAKLVGGTVRATLTRAELSAVVLEGFFPAVPLGTLPTQRPRSALRTLGLPYADDAAITRQLSGFLVRQRKALNELGLREQELDILAPTAVLFNGGVTKSPLLRERVMTTLNAWLGELGQPLARELPGADYDLAVARGASLYGLARRGRGLRVRGGTARAYYVGIESNAPAIPGVEPKVQLLCVAGMGMEEGSRASITSEPLGLVVGEPVRFRFFASSQRRGDEPGSLLPRWLKSEFEELAPVEVSLTAEGRATGDLVPVHLESEVTAIGTLELEAVADARQGEPERWKVELSVRGQG